MDKLEALQTLKVKAEAGLIKISDYSTISDAIMDGSVTSSLKSNALDTLNHLADDNLIDFDTFETLKEAIKTRVTSTPASSNTTNTSSNSSDKPIKGTALGVILSLFLSLIGLILALCLGDEECKSAAIKTFIACIIIEVILWIIIACSTVAVVSSYASLLL